MVQPTYPGVYVEEVSSGVRPITAASTSTAAFIGQAQKGLIGEPVKIYNFTEFQDLYGDYISGGFLAHAVFQFFNNGGSQSYVIRVTGLGALESNIVINDRVPNPNADPSLKIEASSPGVWGDRIEVRVSTSTNDPGNEFKLEVFMQGESTSRETFDNLSMVSDVANFVETRLSGSNYIRATVDPTNNNAVNGTSRGSAAPIGLPLGETILRINVDGGGYQEYDLQTAVPGSVIDLSSPANIVTALNAIVPNLTASLDSGVLLLSSNTASFESSVSVAPASDLAHDCTGYLSLGTLRGGVETLGGAITRPMENTDTGLNPVPRYLVGIHSPVGATEMVFSIQSGSDGGAITNDDPYIDAFPKLDNIDDVSLMAVPGMGSDFLLSAGMNYCANRSLSDCFFIGDMSQDDDDVILAQGFVGPISPKNSYGAVYMPWLLVPDPTGVSAEPIPVPPSGYVAGMYAKTDSNRGVWKAPAGIESALAGTSGLVANLTDVEHGNLNQDPYNVNVIRQFKHAGRVIWGARTISSDPEYRYVPVRRMAIMLRVSLYRGTQWVVFEPNDEPLWAQIRLNVGAFMHNLFRQGAFQGKSPKEAYLVKCDAETTTQNDINQGIVNIIVGFAPLKPAEFVMIKIQQLAGQVEA